MADVSLDMRGRACPDPVVETRKLLINPDTDTLSVLVDNLASAENVRRMASSMGWRTDVKELASDKFEVTVSKDQDGLDVSGTSLQTESFECQSCGPSSKTVVLLASSRFGEGDPELGDILMRAFIKTLKDIDPLPKCLVFVNNGVRLTTGDSVLINDLQTLADHGVEILSCGTCLDYYHLKDHLKVGNVSNMFEIVSRLTSADRLIKL